MEIYWKNGDELWAHFDFRELTEQYDMHAQIQSPNDIKRFLMQNLPKMISNVSEEVNGVIGTGMVNVGVCLDSDGITLQFFGVKNPDDKDFEDDAQESEFDQRFPGLELKIPDKKDYDSEYYYGKENLKKEDKKNVSNLSTNNAEPKLLILQFQSIYQMSEFVAETKLATTTLRSDIYKNQKLYVLVLKGHINKALLNKCWECANSIFPQLNQKNSELTESYLREHGKLVMDGSDGKSPLQVLSDL